MMKKAANAVAAAIAAATEIPYPPMKLKKLLALILCGLDVVALCACSLKTDTALPTPEPTPTETPQYLWTTEYTAIEKSSYSLSPLFFNGDGFYACGMEKVGEDIPDDVINEARKHNKEVVNDGRYDVYENKLCFIHLNGEVTELTDYSQMEEPENENGWNDFSATTNIGGVFTKDNKLYSIEYIYESGNSKPENASEQVLGKDYNEFSTFWYLRQLDSNGKEISCIPVETDGSLSFVTGSFLLTDDTIFAISTIDGRNGIARISTDGKLMSNAMTDGLLSQLIMLGNGNVAVEKDTDTGMELYLYDADSEELNPYLSVENGSGAVSGNAEVDFYYRSNINYLACKDGEASAEFNWSGVNVNPGVIASKIIMQNPNQCLFMTNDGKIVCLNRIAYDADSERKTLILASENPSEALLEAVSSFNQSHYDIKIEVEDYTDYAPSKSGEAALDAYSYNHLGGEIPDIIDLNGLPYESMAREGKFENLYTYIDSDVAINRDDLIPSVIKTLEVNNELYCTAAWFSINTVLGYSDIVGTDIGWNYDDYYGALISMGAGTDGFDSYTSRDEMLSEMLSMDLNNYVDWDNKTCNFTDGKFYNLVCYLNTFPAEVDYASYTEQSKESSDLRLRNRHQMLQRLTLYGIDDVLRAGYEFNGETTFIGYPTDFDTGNTVNVFTFEGGGNLAMSVTCRDKDSAWEFLRTFFLEEYESSSNCFPVNVELFDYEMEESMVQTPILSKKGEQLYDEDGEPRYYEVGTMYLSDYTAVPYYPLTEERAEQLRNLIDTTSKTENYNEDIYRIIKNAMGQENICEIVQEQVSEYLKTLAS